MCNKIVEVKVDSSSFLDYVASLICVANTVVCCPSFVNNCIVSQCEDATC